MSIAHLRVYTINKGQMESWLRLFHGHIAPLLREHDITVEGAWVNDAGDAVHLGAELRRDRRRSRAEGEGVLRLGLVAGRTSTACAAIWRTARSR